MIRIAQIARTALIRLTSRPAPASDTAGRVRREKRVSRNDIEAFLSMELGSLPPLAG